MEVSAVVRETYCQLNYEVYVNPYGDTSLVTEGSWTTEELIRMDEEALSALIRGERPQKPGLLR